MKHVIPFRGVKMPAIRSELHRWHTDDGIKTNLSLMDQKDLGLTLFQEQDAENKLAGVLFLREILLPAGAIECRRDIRRFAELFDRNWIYDWNICDWFCVKVLNPLIKREGRKCAEVIAAWKNAGNLWRGLVDARYIRAR